MNAKQFFKTSAEKVTGVFKRFPVSIICFALLTGLIFADIDWKPWILWGLIAGAFMAMSVDNWRESCENKKIGWGVTLGAYGVHFFITAILFLFQDNDNLPNTIALASVGSTIVLSLFCLPFLQKKNDMPFWHFCYNILIALAISLVFSLTLCGGLELILLSLDELINIRIDDDLYFYIFFICSCFVLPVLFMAYIPSGEEKFKESLPPGNKVSDKLVHYVILPLFGIYLFVLYFYAASIIIRWELPEGMVTYLVSAAMALMLFIVHRLYPASLQEENTFDKKLLKWLPIVMLPLLLLMTVGLFRRISDYGMTILRTYLLLFNIWCYAVCGYLIKTHSKRVIWIPVSIGLTFLATSALPLNISKGIELWMHNSIESQLEKSNIHALPINKAQYERWLLSLEPKTRKKIHNRLSYLSETFESNSIIDLVAIDDYYYYNRWNSYPDAIENAQVVPLNPEEFMALGKTGTSDTAPTAAQPEDQAIETAATSPEPAPSVVQKPEEPAIPPEFQYINIQMKKDRLYQKPISCNKMMLISDFTLSDATLNIETGMLKFHLDGLLAVDYTSIKDYTFEVAISQLRSAEANLNNEPFLVINSEQNGQTQAELYIEKAVYRYVNQQFQLMGISGLLCIK